MLENSIMIVGILKCDRAPEEIIEKIGDYDQSFRNFLNLAINKNDINKNPSLDYQVFECHENNFPTDQEIEEVDGWIITGSRHSAYQKDQWLLNLKELVRILDQRKKKLVGICFGHQVVAEALGCQVIKNPKGWEISACNFELNQLGQEIFDNRNYLRLLYMHQDIIINLNHDSKLRNLGSNAVCQIHGMIKGNHILTIQGHPEYTPLNVEVLLKLRKHLIPKEVIKEGLKKLNQETDQVYLAKKILSFLRSTL